MAEYYGVSRSDEYLAHYGIKGMKWGVRKAIASGNDRALGRQFRKAQKKLAKLEKRAASGKKYAKRAVALGAGAAAAGGLAAAGTTGVSKGIAKAGEAGLKVSRSIGRGLTLVPGRNKVSQALHNTGVAMYRAGDRGSAAQKGIASVSKAVNDWGKGTSLSKGAGQLLANVPGRNAVSQTIHRGAVKAHRSGVTNNTIARIGAAGVGAGLAGAAGYNAYRAATTKRAGRKAAQFRSEMQKSFAGTRYANQVGQPRKKKRR